MLFNHPRADATPATQQEHHPWERQRENTHVAQPWAFKHHSFCCISPSVCACVCVRVYLISLGNLPFYHYRCQIAYGLRSGIPTSQPGFETEQKCINVLNYRKIFLFVGSDLHLIKCASLIKSACDGNGHKTHISTYLVYIK